MADRGSKSQLTFPHRAGEAASGLSAASAPPASGDLQRDPHAESGVDPQAGQFPWQHDMATAEPETVVRLPQPEQLSRSHSKSSAVTSRSRSRSSDLQSAGGGSADGEPVEAGLQDEPGELSGTRTVNADSYLLKRLFPNSAENNASSDQQLFEEMSLAHFRLISRLGVGGMGSVFLAEDEVLRRQVALKILSPGQSRDESSVARFQNEARAAASLDHPNVARVFSSGEDRGLHFIAYEYVEGRNLRDRIRQSGRIDPAEAVYYTIQLAEALVHLSAMNVVHRDIKPSNILINRNGRVKLVDLGLARCQLSEESVELTVAGTTLGTFDYISPEQAKDPRTVDVRSDIYSLGCTLYHMLTGEPPYPEGTVLQKLLDHQGRESPDPAVKNRLVSPALSMLVRKMMASDRRKRYYSAEELLGDLTILARQMGIPTSGSVVMAPPRNRLQDGIRQNIGWLATVALLVMVVVLLDRFPQLFPVKKDARNNTWQSDGQSDSLNPVQVGATPRNPLERRPLPDTRSPLLANTPTGGIAPLARAQSQIVEGLGSRSTTFPQDSNLVGSNSASGQERPPVPAPVELTGQGGTGTGLAPQLPTDQIRFPADMTSGAVSFPTTSQRPNAEGITSTDSTDHPEAAISQNSSGNSSSRVNPISPLLIPFDDSFGPSSWLENIFSTKPSSSTGSANSGASLPSVALPSAGTGQSRSPTENRTGLPESSLPRSLNGLSESTNSGKSVATTTGSSSTAPLMGSSPATDLNGSRDRTGSERMGPDQSLAERSLIDRSPAAPSLVVAPVRIVDGKGFDSLEAACVSAKSGDVIELRYQGRLLPSEKPIRLSGKSLTIRAAKGFRPTIRFAPQDSLQPSMITMTGGSLAVINIDLEWDLPETVTADLWSLFSTQRIDKLSLQNVRITVRNPRQSAATVLRQSAPAGQAPTMIAGMKTGPGAASTPETTLSSCLIRGTSRFCTLDDPAPARYVVENSVIAVDDDIFRSMGLMDVMAEVDRVEINFNHVTVLTRQHFLKLGSGDDFSVSLTPLAVTLRNSILAVGHGKPLILQQGMAGETDLRRFLSWSGERNFYDAIEPIWQTSNAAYKMKFDKWKQFWSVGGELSSSQNLAIEWRGRWMLKPFDTLIPEDVELDATSDSNPLLNAATDGTDVGVNWQTLPHHSPIEAP
ncbi:Serine/threonine-protein kinase PknB [Planctopirus ephydatiae]|uniref:Serine/threonine-protein kinase PknB n=1 Tax=Planctopirus ephydatiae TaxID=2528019 RepID=A0A518GU87_9PLAN|nr:serine/threonine-protein kinase [Planctopirus ephydatiae]QDV32141.1 Serine/threonine-protein kinase PknB [Planctopirus ephydatiae]